MLSSCSEGKKEIHGENGLYLESSDIRIWAWENRKCFGLRPVVQCAPDRKRLDLWEAAGNNCGSSEGNIQDGAWLDLTPQKEKG